MYTTDFPKLTTFMAVAERGSFVQAAHVLGLSPSTVSQAVRDLEDSLGIRLLNRTTRRVAVTEAGAHLLARLRPALDDLNAAIEGLNAFRDAPVGTVRLSVSSLALSLVIAPILPGFSAAYPDIRLEVVVDNDSGDLIGGQADAGVRGSPRIPQDMIAVRIGAPSRLVAVASPAYVQRCGRPQTPADLKAHNCILFRFPTGATSPWTFDDGGRPMIAPASGSLVTDNIDVILRAAVDGVGIAYTLASHAQEALRAGDLEVVLEDYARPFDGWFIYHPSRRQNPAPLRALIEFLTARGGARGQAA